MAYADLHRPGREKALAGAWSDLDWRSSNSSANWSLFERRVPASASSKWRRPPVVKLESQIPAEQADPRGRGQLDEARVEHDRLGVVRRADRCTRSSGRPNLAAQLSQQNVVHRGSHDPQPRARPV